MVVFVKAGSRLLIGWKGILKVSNGHEEDELADGEVMNYMCRDEESTIGGDSWSVYRRYRKFRELHKSMRKHYHEVGGSDFPNRRFFGNRAEEFVRVRRAQLETYLQSFLGLCSKISDRPISDMSGRPLTKRDLCDFAPFFKQGIFEQTRNYSG